MRLIASPQYQKGKAGIFAGLSYLILFLLMVRLEMVFSYFIETEEGQLQQ